MISKLSFLLTLIHLGSSFSMFPTGVFLEEEFWQSSCCPLEWVRADQSDPNAVLNLITDDGNFVLIKNSDSFSFEKFTVNTTRSHSFILSNPNSCKVSWEQKVRSKIIYRPTFDGKILSLSNISALTDGYDRYSRRNTNYFIVAELYDLMQFSSPGSKLTSKDYCRGSSYSDCRVTHRSVLSVDCFESIRSIIEPRLVSIDYKNTSQQNDKDVSVTIATHDVVNLHPYEVSYRFNYAKYFPLKFNLTVENMSIPFIHLMKNETNVKPFIESNSESLLLKLFPQQNPTSFTGEYSNSNLKSSLLWNLYKYHDYSSHPDRYEFLSYDDEMKIPANSSCKISAKLNYHNIDEEVSITFAVTPQDAFKNHWNNERILASLKSSRADLSNLVEENGQLVMKFNGHLNLQVYSKDEIQNDCERR